MKKLYFPVFLLFMFVFISCNENLASQHKVKPMVNEDKINSKGLIQMTETEINSVHLAVKPLRGILPNSYDLSDYFPPVGSQDNQGSCAAWSSGYNYKSFQENFERGWGYSSYDNIMSPAFVYNYAHNGESEYACNNAGMTLKDAADILKYVGIVSWTEMPYDDSVCSVGPTQSMISHAYKYRIDDYKRVEFNDFKTFIASNMPIFFGAEIFENFGNCWAYSTCMDEYINNGNVFKTLKGQSEGGHAMVLVGYNDQKQAFKLINSWGTSWGQRGYLWVSYTVLKEMLRGFGTYGYVFIDHIENPCEGIDCGAYGECKVSPQKTAYCECDNGYKSDMLTCIKCEANSYKQCYNNSVYWYNSCGENESLAESCSNGCENLGIDNAQCVSNCTSHSTQKCYENDIYWYDSCNHKESLALDCGSKICNDQGSGNVECKENCIDNAVQKCYDNDIYWYNSCGEKGLLVERCIDECVNTENGAKCELDDPCAMVNCPDNSECKISSNNETACYCIEGYHVNENATACESDEDNTQVDLCENVNCPDNSTCKVYNDEAGCYCNDDYHVENGACVSDIPDVCIGINCEQWYGNTVCVEYNGSAGCDCKDGYHWSGDNCVR